ncbi:3-oxoadipate enol-lactonase/4-carboxymuconolactone decarboxylase [Brevibacterium sanguinis]|uniref:3-oxoadipate enol-lactonase/4-carboxymuconolactone decarboxylase n=2 Tax=Brevibacterium TaxID=1696 RepID=A0A366IFK5_9MICO|nr:3-oxoadipate enol-lactonase/4-carboxymuconolactone decarboxylase [Brevibacterium sanguinis]RBP69358.1 3-oxoadipate enol-lactonase/4-carboxymuconolactone decarboxylase [Brevibacterium celere]
MIPLPIRKCSDVELTATVLGSSDQTGSASGQAGSASWQATGIAGPGNASGTAGPGNASGRAAGAAGPDNRPHATDVLVVLPSLGTSVSALWQRAASAYCRSVPAATVIGIDLPGHGRSAPLDGAGEAVASVTMSDLAEAVLATIDRVLPDVVGHAGDGGSVDDDGGTAVADGTPAAAGTEGPRIALAGDSIGGAIALQLALDHGERFSHVAVFCTGAQIGEPAAWIERADLVAASGTPTQVVGSAQRWFGPGFMDREPEASAALLHSLQDADRFSYAALCHALAAFDVRDRLTDIPLPVLAVAGSEDQPTRPTKLVEIANGVRDGRLEVIEGAGHLVPAEAPEVTAALLDDFLHGTGRAEEATASATQLPTASGPREASRDEVHTAGMTVRREVLSDAHVDRANAAITEFTSDFQDLITRYAWGEIWTRPGLDRRMRSAITLTAMIAGGHEAELAMHVRAAVRNGLSRDEIKEVLLQSAIYCSVPSANTAFTVAAKTLAEMDEEDAPQGG